MYGPSLPKRQETADWIVDINYSSITLWFPIVLIYSYCYPSTIYFAWGCLLYHISTCIHFKKWLKKSMSLWLKANELKNLSVPINAACFHVWHLCPLKVIVECCCIFFVKNKSGIVILVVHNKLKLVNFLKWGQFMKLIRSYILTIYCGKTRE